MRRALGSAARALVGRRAPPAPGRYALNRKASVHGFISVSPAPPWREYLIYLPRGYTATRKLPLVVWIHGCRQDPEEFAAGTRIARFADEREFVVLLPRQSRLANSERCWNWFDRRSVGGGGEVAIVAAQIGETIEKLALDARRVYVAGLSSGGSLAAMLALRAPQLFAAAAMHSAVPCGSAYDAADATRVMAHGPRGGTDELAVESRAKSGGRARVPALILQGAEDRAVAPLNAAYLVRQFLILNGADALPPAPALPPAQVAAFQRRAAYVASDYYAGRRLAARLVSVPGLAHAWSGGDPAYPFFDERSLDATELVSDFFASRRR